MGVGRGTVNRHYLIALGIFVVVGIALFAMLTFFVAPSAGYGSYVPAATGNDLDAETLKVAKGLYCPVCPNVPLDVCETQACQQWRGLIRQKLSEGQSASQIEAYFVEQYGERVLGAPRAQGLNLVVYGLPAFAVAAGAALLYLFAQRRVGKGQPAPVSIEVSKQETELRSRIERELRQDD